MQYNNKGWVFRWKQRGQSKYCKLCKHKLLDGTMILGTRKGRTKWLFVHSNDEDCHA